MRATSYLETEERSDESSCPAPRPAAEKPCLRKLAKPWLQTVVRYRQEGQYHREWLTLSAACASVTRCASCRRAVWVALFPPGADPYA